MQRAPDETLIDEIQREIESILRETESATLSLSDHLGGIVRGAEEFVGEIKERVGLIDTDGQDGVATTLDSQCVAVDGFVSELDSSILAQSQVADQIIDASRNVAEAAEAVANVSMQSRILCFNTMVEAGRLGDLGRPFMVIAGEMRDLSEGIAASNERISRLAAKLIPLLESVKRNISTLQGSRERFSDEFEETRHRIGCATDQLRSTARASLDAGDTKLASIIDQSNEALVSLQVQDLVSQRLQRILRLAGREHEAGEFISETLADQLSEGPGGLTSGEFELF